MKLKEGLDTQKMFHFSLEKATDTLT